MLGITEAGEGTFDIFIKHYMPILRAIVERLQTHIMGPETGSKLFVFVEKER